MNESMKNYNKAMEKFQAGKINRALEYCEEAVALDLNNRAALNLKGMILYLKGNLNAAEASWKVNSNINNDGIASSYLENIAEDEEREFLYNRALKEIKAFNIEEAIDLLEKAKESDFNAINVYNALTYCYIKVGYLEKAKASIDKVISIEKNNKVANDYIKELNNNGKSYKNIINKKVALAGSIAIGFVVIGGSLLLSEGVNYKKIESEGKKPPVVAQDDLDKNKEEGTKPEGTKPEVKKEYNLKKLIESKNYEELMIAFEGNRDSISVENQKDFEEAKEILETKGVKYFYDKGLNEFKAGEFGNANKEFQNGFKYAKGSYLERHLNYMIAVSYEKLENFDEAISYYEKFNKSFEDGEYSEEVLYKLAVLNKEKDLKKSKNYAWSLKEKYPNSIYNNDNIRSILNKE